MQMTQKSQQIKTCSRQYFALFKEYNNKKVEEVI